MGSIVAMEKNCEEIIWLEIIPEKLKYFTFHLTRTKFRAYLAYVD